MFHRNIKLILAALIIIAGIWQFTESNIGNGIFLLFLSAFPIFLYYKNEFILLAFLKLRKQDFPGAQKWLAYIKNPETALVQVRWTAHREEAWMAWKARRDRWKPFAVGRRTILPGSA